MRQTSPSVPNRFLHKTSHVLPCLFSSLSSPIEASRKAVSPRARRFTPRPAGSLYSGCLTPLTGWSGIPCNHAARHVEHHDQSNRSRRAVEQDDGCAFPSSRTSKSSCRQGGDDTTVLVGDRHVRRTRSLPPRKTAGCLLSRLSWVVGCGAGHRWRGRNEKADESPNHEPLLTGPPAGGGERRTLHRIQLKGSGRRNTRRDGRVAVKKRLHDRGRLFFRQILGGEPFHGRHERLQVAGQGQRESVRPTLVRAGQRVPQRHQRQRHRAHRQQQERQRRHVGLPPAPNEPDQAVSTASEI